MRADHPCRELPRLDQANDSRARYAQDCRRLLGGQVVRRTEHHGPFTVGSGLEDLSQSLRNRPGKVEHGAVLGSDRRVRAEMAEMAAGHRSSLSVLEERHKAELKELTSETKTKVSRLDEEKQFLGSSIEKLKRQTTGELKRATDTLAHEKQLH